MNSGKMREQITIQRATITHDAFGQETKSWEVHFFSWAQIEDLSGSGSIPSQVVQSQASHRVTLWWRPDLKVTDRVLWGDRILDIVHINDVDQRHIKYVLLCMERMA
jgi:SPP1 family predicted phage head-tail adaptor